MQQRVDIDQAKLLFDNGIFVRVGDDIEYNEQLGGKTIVDWCYYRCTIGDLVEWLCEKTKLTWVVLFERMAEEYTDMNPDLLQALVDMCICVKVNEYE